MNQSDLIHFTMQFVVILGNLITYAIIGRILVSWLSMGRMGPRGRFSQFLYSVTDPVIAVARKIPHRVGMFDLSPLIALIAIDLLVGVVIVLLNKMV